MRIPAGCLNRLAPQCLCLLLSLALAPPPARAAPPAEVSPASLCEQAIAFAEQRGRTPPGMLAAIGAVESGRPDPRTGAIRPWPWTINVGGAGQYFVTRAQAIDAVQRLQAQGVRSIDVGCMQVNLMFHPDAFASLLEAFEPMANAAYAVRFLSVLYAQTGSWPKSVAAYHSETPDIGADYQRRVLAIWKPPPPEAPPTKPALVETPDGLIYGAYGSSGRVYGLILPKPPATQP